ncbi:MAG: ImmA/IrrE family metallo-endopeptidase [Sphaerochaetaceae bacterium]|nr:ImmA/IrrE family metallo-endopeptidase [Sphaerochaetaceae bacterium]MDD4219048.1 ImmA/IrrE family metallo-endopeptidase [Sphaerochaetaceae bacterium]
MNARKWLNKYGIYLVIHDALTRYKNNPAIYLSLRFKTHDHAWFALMHEIGHLLVDFNGRDPFITCIEDETAQNEYEKEADKFAQNFFIDSEDYNKYRKGGQISKRFHR